MRDTVETAVQCIAFIALLAAGVSTWGEPDILDGLIKRANNVQQCGAK